MQVKKGASVRIECSASGKFQNASYFVFIPRKFLCFDLNNLIEHCDVFEITGNPSPNITWTRKFENLPNGK